MAKTKPKSSEATGDADEAILIRGGLVIDPASDTEALLDVLLRDGRVAEMGPGLKAENAEVMEARGLVVCPGLIDLHVHLREPGASYKESIASGTAAAAAGGFTSVCAMPNTDPVNDTRETTTWMLLPERRAVVNVFPIAAATKGSAGEQLTDYRALRQAGAVAVSDDGKPVLEDRVMREALIHARHAGFPVIQHAEDTRLTQNCSMNYGPTAFRLGLRGMPAEAESRIVARDIALADETGAHLHVAHLSTAAALEALRRAKRDGLHVTCEVTPHHFTLTDEAVANYDSHCKMNPPLRSAADRDAVTTGLADGTVDAIASDHAPHAAHEKHLEFERAAFGIIGLETALALAITRLHREHGISLQRIVELMTANPARIAGLGERGTLSVGSHADVTIFDSKKRWKYQAEHSRSKSRNTPFDGWQLWGKVVATIVGGKVVFRES